MDEDENFDGDVAEVPRVLRKGMVAVELTKETKNHIRKPWSKTIIVKLVGRFVGFNYTQSKLSQLWRLSGCMDCVDLTHGFFLVRFYIKEDLESMLEKGPWFISDFFLSLRPWESFFKPSTANVSSIAVWVHLHELPIELYKAKVLKQLGESLGKILRIDAHTAMEARGKYARLYIQIDVNKPLTDTILIGRFEQPVTYEGIHKLCFTCGRVGHTVETCPYMIRRENDQVPMAEDGRDGVAGNSCNKHEDQRPPSDSSTPCTSGKVENEGQYGPWMVVATKRYGFSGTNKEPNSVGSSKSHWGASPHPSGENVKHRVELDNNKWAKPHVPARKGPSPTSPQAFNQGSVAPTQFTSGTIGLNSSPRKISKSLSPTIKPSPLVRPTSALVKGRRALMRVNSSFPLIKSSAAPQTVEVFSSPPLSAPNPFSSS